MFRNLDERISEHACFDAQKTSYNNKVFLEILDKILEAQSVIEALKKKDNIVISAGCN